MRDLANRLERDLDRYKKLASYLKRTGTLSASNIGLWPAAQELGIAHSQAGDAIGTLFDAYVEAYASLISRIRKTIQVHENAEWDTLAEIHKVEGNANGPSGDPASAASNGMPRLF